jgi:hypothetical protein
MTRREKKQRTHFKDAVKEPLKILPILLIHVAILTHLKRYRANLPRQAIVKNEQS